MAYGIFRKVTTLEFLQHHFAKSGHGDGLLMTRQLISTARQPPLHYLTRSVRRTSGFVLADQPGVGPRGSLACKGLARVCSSRSNRSSECHPVAVTPIVARLRRCASERPQPDTFVIDAKQVRKASDRCVWVRLESCR